jgi:hypothetical protein
VSEQNTVPATGGVSTGARLLVVLMGVAWGMHWIATRVILEALSPWSLRVVGIGLGALVLMIAAAVSRTNLSVPRGAWLKLTIAAFFNVGIFNVCSAIRRSTARPRAPSSSPIRCRSGRRCWPGSCSRKNSPA